MKDFKNENEHDNMKLDDETYEGILLKTGDEGYRYYSEDDYSEDGSIADIIITCGYVSETSSTARVNMSARCVNADDLYIRLLKDEGTVLYSTGTSGTSFSTQKTFVSAGTYIVEAEVVRTNGGRKVRRAPLKVETRVAEPNRCDMCDDTGWRNHTTKCTNCGEWQTHAAPIQLGHYVVSESISTATINMTASCTNAVDMYLRVIREDGTECYSRHASSTTISKTMPLGAGQYTLQAEAISLTGGISIETRGISVVLNSGNTSPGGSGSSSCYNCGGTGYVGSANCSICNPSNGSSGGSSNNCSNCGGTGYVGSVNCSICNPSLTNQGEISYTYSYEAISETTTKLTVNANCSTASSMYVEVYRSSSTSRYHSEGTSANHITTTATLGTGAYTVKIRAVCSSGNDKEVQFDVTLNGASYDCSYCNDTGWYGSYLCTNCEKGNSIESIVINSATESVSSCLVKLSVSASCCEPTNQMYIYVYSAGTSNVKYSTMASSYHVEGEETLLFGSYEIEVLAYLGNGTVKTKRIPIELEVDEGFDDSEVHPLPTYVIEHSENIYFNYGNNNYTVTINAMCENADRVEVEVINEQEPEISGSNYRFVLNAGKHDVKIRAYVGNDEIEESFELDLHTEEMEMTPVSITKSEVKSNGAHDVTFDVSCDMANVMYLWVHDNDNNNNLVYSANGSNYITSTAELHPGNYNVVIHAVNQYQCGFTPRETTLIIENTETDTEGGIGGGDPTGGDEDDTTTTPEVEDDTNVTYNIQYLENNTFNLTINYSGEKAIKYNVVPKYIRDTELVGQNQSGTYTTSTQIELYEGVYRIDITTVAGNELLKKQLFAVEKIKDENGTVTDKVIHYNTAHPERKFLLLYVIANENAYDEIAAKIVNTSGATDIVILTNYPINHCKDADGKDVTIMNSETIEDDLLKDKAESEYPFNPADKHVIISQMKNAINHVEQTWQETYEHYIECVKNLKKSLLQDNKALKIWVGLPQMVQATNPNATEGTPPEELNGNCTPAAELYTDCYTILVNNVLNDAEINDDNFEGFYYGEEAVPTWYTKFDYDDLNNFNNVVVDNMDSMSDYIRGDMVKKKFMWIPYYQVVNESGDDNIVKRTRSIVNELDLFDYIILQPSSYFNYYEANKVPAENIEYVRKCVEKGECLIKSEAQASCDTYTTTGFLGMEMEIDSTIEKSTETGETARALYGEYVFQYLMTKNKKAPVAFYAGDVESVSNTTVLNEISELYT